MCVSFNLCFRRRARSTRSKSGDGEKEEDIYYLLLTIFAISDCRLPIADLCTRQFATLGISREISLKTTRQLLAATRDRRPKL